MEDKMRRYTNPLMSVVVGSVAAALAALVVASAPIPATAAVGPEIVEFRLVDADTDTVITTLADYDTLRLPMLAENLSIEAVADGETESVRMEIDHAHSSTENHAPYALRGDASGDFNPAPELRVPGWITISAQPYGGHDLSGTAGAEVHLHLYLHQPDFVVDHPADVGDYDPGDGWCTTGKPPTVIDDFKAVLPGADLSRFEAKLRAIDFEGFERSVKDGSSERADGLASTIEIDEAASSKRTRRQAVESNEVAAEQIRTRNLPGIVSIDTEVKLGLDVDLGADPAVEEGARAEERSADEHDLEAAEEFRLDSLVELDRLDFGRAVPRFDIDVIDDLVFEWVPRHSCTLRAAVEEANALAGKQSVLIDSAKGPFNLTQGDIEITDAIDLVGHGTRAVIDSLGNDRVFYITGDHIMNLRNLDLAGGNVGTSNRGGVLYITEDALVQLSGSVVRDGRGNFGGGIYLQAGGDLTMWDTAVRNNTAGTPENFGGGGITQRGGGIFNLEGVVKIYDSSISDNIAVRGGGLSNFGGLVRIENSSVIDNEALSIGGGIENRDNSGETGRLHLAFATVAHNEAGTSPNAPADQRNGGGLHNSARAYVASTILADNTDPYGPGDPHHAPDCHSPVPHDATSYRNNLVGVLNSNCDLGDYSWGTPVFYQWGTEAAPLDPELTAKFASGHLAFRNLWPGSPAVDQGGSAGAIYPCEDHDGRGNPRPVGAGCDVGAIERQ